MRTGKVQTVSCSPEEAPTELFSHTNSDYENRKEDVSMMQNHVGATIYDAHRLLKELDLHEDERKKCTKEIILRFNDRQFEKLKSFDTLGLKEQLNIMQAVIDFIVKQVKNGTDGLE